MQRPNNLNTDYRKSELSSNRHEIEYNETFTVPCDGYVHIVCAKNSCTHCL